MREAQSAETAIQNLSTQLQSWRDAYGKQLAELGLAPGSDTSAAGSGDQGSDGTTRVTSYGSPGFSRSTGPGPSPRILDRKA
jgi:hypothetical protein